MSVLVVRFIRYFGRNILILGGFGGFRSNNSPCIRNHFIRSCQGLIRGRVIGGFRSIPDGAVLKVSFDNTINVLPQVLDISFGTAIIPFQQAVTDGHFVIADDSNPAFLFTALADVGEALA